MRQPEQHRSRAASAQALTALGIGSIACTAADGQIQFGQPVYYVDAQPAISSVVADLNGDALNDLAVLNEDAIYIYLNQGGGELLLDTIVPVLGREQGTMRAGDVDGDGAVDLVFLETYSWWTGFSIWYNSGDGRNGEFQHIRYDYFARSFELADLDGNGWLDIVHIRRNPEVNAIWNFSRTQSESGMIYYFSGGLGPGALQIVPGDVDRDGDVDLTIAYLSGCLYYWGCGSAVVLLLNNGNGRNFASQQIDVSWPENDLDRIAQGDMDGDGDLDTILVGSRVNYYAPGPALVRVLYTEEQSVRFGPNMEIPEEYVVSVATADFDTDGRLDIAVNSSLYLYVLQNTGSGFLTSVRTLHGGWAGDVLVEEIHGDGRWDIATPGRYGAVVYPNASQTRLELHQTPLVRGEQASFGVRRANPGEQVVFLASITGAGNSVGQSLLGGATLDLLDPVVVLGAATANESGIAVLSKIVPAQAPLVTLTTQAVVRRGPGGRNSVKTPFRAARIEE